MKQTLFLIGLLGCASLTAQEILPIQHDSIEAKSWTEISSQNYHASNALNNDFTNKFLFGGEVTGEIKDRAQDKLGSVNRFGAESNQNITHYSRDIHPFGGTRYGLVVNFSDNHLLSSNISTDLFNTVMYGNAAYIGDTMDFSFTHFQYLHYQKFGFGLYDTKTRSSVRISYVAGSKTIESRLNNSFLVSQPDNISLMLQGTGFKSDRFYPYWAFQGAGFAVDVNYNFNISTKKFGDQMMNLQVNNLGIIFWNNQSSTYFADSTTNYTGFDVQDFINRDENAEAKTYNFIDTLGVIEGKGNNRTGLPIEFVLQKMPQRNHENKFQSIFGFKTILTSDYAPYFFAGVYYSPVQNFSASTRLSYGGFGRLQWGLNLNYWIQDKAYIGLGTFDMIGNIASEIGYGRSVNFSVHFKI